MDDKSLSGLLKKLFGADADRVQVIYTRFNAMTFVQPAGPWETIEINSKTDDGIEYGFSLVSKILIIKGEQ